MKVSIIFAMLEGLYGLPSKESSRLDCCGTGDARAVVARKRMPASVGKYIISM